MEAYDFLHEWVKPIIKGDYQDFSSKKVEGYSLFVSEYKKPHVQAMVNGQGRYSGTTAKHRMQIQRTIRSRARFVQVSNKPLVRERIY